jgi:quercetin dioxygenase-like cupin family protein
MFDRRAKIVDVGEKPKNFFEGGGGFNRRVITKQEEGIDISCSLATIEPGKAHDWHDHEQDEVAYIIQGSGKYFLKDGEIEYKAGDIVFLPKGTMHKNLVLGNEPLILFAVFNPAIL